MADRAGSAGLKQVLMDLHCRLMNVLVREVLRPAQELGYHGSSTREGAEGEEQRKVT